MAITILPVTRQSRFQPPRRPQSGRAMSNGRSHLDIFAGLFTGSDLDDDSDFDDDATIASNETGGGSYFDELSLASEDNLDIYGQGTGQDGDDSDNASDTSRARRPLHR